MNNIFKKRFALLGLSGGLAMGVILPITNLTVSITNQELTNKVIDKSLLQNRILRESYQSGSEKYYKYDGQIFGSENELNNYIFDKGQIQNVITSSNPLKIIKDHEHMILDENKIFDTNINNFTEVFEDALGNVTFDENTALKTYLNGGNVDQEYSYDGVNWYDSESEARLAEKREMKISSSLYYVVNNKYYNAFNLNDINDLVNNMQEGYYTKLEKNIDGSSANEVKEFAGDKNLINKLLKNHFVKDFQTNYYQQISDAQITNGISITPSEYKSIQINGKYFRSGNKAEITFAKHYTSKAEMINDFENKDKWTKEEDKKLNNFWTRKFDLIIDNQHVQNAEIILNSPPKISYEEDSTGHNRVVYTAMPINKVSDTCSWQENTTGHLYLYKNQDKKELLKEIGPKQNIYNVYLTNDEMSDFYNAWFGIYFNEVITNFGLDANKPVRWEDIKNNLFIRNTDEFLAGSILKDKIYEVNPGKGYNQSLLKSYFEWEVIKNEIIKDAIEKNKGEIPAPEAKAYEVRPNLFVTRQDLDDFLFLQGNVDARIMYSVSDKEHASDREGKLLAQTETQAKELKALFNEESLKIRYVIYDIKGNIIRASGNDKQTVLDYLKKEIQLNAKFVHNDEIKKWNNLLDIKWADIISDGNYLVYSIPNPNSVKRIWFLSKASALDALKTNLKVSSDLEVLTEDIYIFNFLTEQGIILPIKYKMNELETLVDQIYNYES